MKVPLYHSGAQRPSPLPSSVAKPCRNRCAAARQALPNDKEELGSTQDFLQRHCGVLLRRTALGFKSMREAWFADVGLHFKQIRAPGSRAYPRRQKCCVAEHGACCLSVHVATKKSLCTKSKARKVCSATRLWQCWLWHQTMYRTSEAI